MKVFITLLFFAFSFLSLAQNVGINQPSPTNPLHITPLNAGDNPIRIDGIQPYSIGDTSLLIINTTTGIVKYINTTDFVSFISGGAGLGTDNQNIDSLVLTGYNLETFISNGNSSSVDLSPLSDSITNSIINNSNFENQIVSILYDNADTLLYNSSFINSLRDSIDTDIDSLTLNNTTLTIYENGSSASVDLSSLSDNDSDPTNELQTISKSGSTVTLSNGGGSFTDDDTQLSETQVDAFVNNNGYLTSFTEVDGSVTNEIELPTGGSNGQILSTNGSGTYSWINDNSGSDNQNISGSSFNATTGNLVIGIQNGTNQTVNFNGLKDHDWYEVGGTTAPNNINDNIFTQGNVGIGDANPSEMLSVKGNIRVGGSATGPNYIAFHGTTLDGPNSYTHGFIGEHIYAGTESSELFIFKGNDAATVAGPDRIRLASGDILFDTYSTPLNGGFSTVASSPLLTNRMIIKDNGNIGIGISIPLAKLHVVGGDAYFTDQPINNFNSSRSAQAVVTDNLRAASDNGIRLYDGNTNSHLHMGSLTHSYLQAYTINSIGPGTLGSSTVDLDDNTNFANIWLNPLGGRIGIGTTTPTEILNVNGNIKVGVTNSGALQPAGFGNSIYFSGAPDVSSTFDGENSDIIRIARYNLTSDQSELRVIIGDNNQAQDAFSIGYGTFTEVFRLENSGVARKPGGGSWAATSDKRTKKDIVQFSDGLSVLNKINPVTFKYNGLYNTSDDGKDYVGIIAQEVQEVAPYMIGSYNAKKTSESKEQEEILNYDGGTYMLYVLVNSVKEQQKQIEELKKNNKILLDEIKNLKK